MGNLICIIFTLLKLDKSTKEKKAMKGTLTLKKFVFLVNHFTNLSSFPLNIRKKLS